MSPVRPVAIFWDYENCSPPSSMNCYEVVHKIRDVALKYGAVHGFKAYLQLAEFSSNKGISLRSELQACGVSLIDCPSSGRKDVADKMIIVDMLQYGWDNPPPSTIILISGDRDFAYAVSVLRLRRYDVVVVAPHLVHGHLKHQATNFHDWDAVIRSDYQRSFVGVEEQNMALAQVHPSSHRPTTSDVVPAVPRGHTGHSFSQKRTLKLGELSDSSDLSNVEDNVADLDHWVPDTSIVPVTPRKSAPSIESCGSTLVSSLTPSSNTNFNQISRYHVTYAGDSQPTVEETPRCGRKVPPRAATSPFIVSGKTITTFGSPHTRPTTAGPIMVSPKVPDAGGCDSEELHNSISTFDDLPDVLSYSAPALLPSVPAKPTTIQPGLEPLVQVLEKLRQDGEKRPLRSQVAIAVTKLQPKAYELAGVSKFKQYTDLAMQHGIVELGGFDGTAWISLLPN